MAVQREKKSYPFKAVVQPRPQTLERFSLGCLAHGVGKRLSTKEN
jgi:hypothetical protein